ncbi:MAG: hypothetical protein ACNS62_11245 [Candidatus Cyclobacteriaceae bacterium M3_2C_046]
MKKILIGLFGLSLVVLFAFQIPEKEQSQPVIEIGQLEEGNLYIENADIKNTFTSETMDLDSWSE